MLSEGRLLKSSSVLLCDNIGSIDTNVGSESVHIIAFFSCFLFVFLCYCTAIIIANISTVYYTTTVYCTTIFSLGRLNTNLV